MMEINFTHKTQITSLTGFFEGKFRTEISNQVEFRQIITFRIEFDDLIRQWCKGNGKIYAPAGQHKTEAKLVIGEECPGSYMGKYGSIEYLTAVKLCIPGRIGNTKLVKIYPVRVISVMNITSYLPFHIPFHIERYFHKKFFCLNKSSIKVFIKLPKTAFVQGESIVINGKISNEHPKNPIKNGIVELVMVVRFRCKNNEKFTNATLSYFTLPLIPQCSIIEFQCCLQIPNNAFPTYSHPDALINSSYHLSIVLNECTPIEIPVIIGTEISTRFADTQNYQPSLLPIPGNIKIQLLSSQQTFPSLSIQPQLLSLSRLHLSSLPTSQSSPSIISSPYFNPNFDKHLIEPHFIQPFCTSFPFHHPILNYHSQATLFPGEFPITYTRYKGQSVLRIEEIE
ncbi:unnamed protein product [Acanthocheilonema viteae]|uniref:Arrestin C-terminal-like domain-containing protein n=1 Tax=Acanthocheilonema viteae TaxID=6277 RepID=A0A498SAE4_ACAVI|nr:unnamed protein product [Acanthocheilonema viteae]